MYSVVNYTQLNNDSWVYNGSHSWLHNGSHSVTYPNVSHPGVDEDDDEHDYKWSKEFSILLAIINILVVCCIVFGNVMVLLVIVRHRGMRTRTNLFLVNLAVADLFVGLFAMPFSITTLLKHTWIFGDTVCMFNGWMNSFCLITSIHTLMYISIHKYYSIVKPLKRSLTLRTIVIMMSLAWFWAAVCSTLNVFGLKVTYKRGTSQCGPNYPSDALAYCIHVLIQITDLIIPFVVLIFCYIRIFLEIRKLSKRLRAHSSVEDRDIIAQEKGVAITMFIVLATFVVMILPYLAYANYTTIRQDKKHFSGYLNPVAYTFLYTSSMCNPIIYAFRSKAFREGYKEILCQKATYASEEEANNPQRTNRLLSLIAILRRGSLPANQNVIQRNGDIVFFRGDRIVCVRSANARFASPNNDIQTIPENENESEEKESGKVENEATVGDNGTVCLIPSTSGLETLSTEFSDDSGGAKFFKFIGGIKKNGHSAKNKSRGHSLIETPEISQNEKSVHDTVDQPEQNLWEVEDVGRIGHGRLSDTQRRPRAFTQPAADNQKMSAATKKFGELLAAAQRKPAFKPTLKSRSSEDLSSKPTLVRLPSLEFLDPPIQVFGPRDKTASLERLGVFKSKGKSPAKETSTNSESSPKLPKSI